VHGQRGRRLWRDLRHQYGVGCDPFVDQPAGHDPTGLRAEDGGRRCRHFRHARDVVADERCAVLFGLLAEVNIGQLLISGIIPAMLVTATIIGTIYLLVTLDPSRAPRGPATGWSERFRLLWQVSPMVVLFGIVTGTIYLGIATPTEASAFGAFGALLLAGAKRKLTPSSLYKTLLRATHGTCMITMILLGASIFGHFFTLSHVTQDLVAYVGALPVSRWIIIALLLAGYIALGSFMTRSRSSCSPFRSYCR
jgi:TRAP-type C4-dicarboxylate transport system permease large subunit